MEKVTVKTVELAGAEMKVEGLRGQNTVIVNHGGGTLYASASPNVEAGADNVIEIPAGARDGLNGTHGTVYLLGSGRVELRGTDYAVNFRQPSSSESGGGGGTGDVTKAYVDTQDITNLGIAKAYTDTQINTVKSDISDDIEALQTEKADKTEIPTSLPANGGNSSTVNGHTVNADVPANAVFTDTVVDISGKMDTSNPTGSGSISINRRLNTTIGDRSVAMGYVVIASGSRSAAIGDHATASGQSSFATGHYSKASNVASFVCGKYGKETISGGSLLDNIGDAFLIGNGVYNNNTATYTSSNVFRVAYDGNIYGTKSFTSSGADYAEYIKPWFDNNPDDEDRVGYFVTIKDGKLHFAESTDYIVGITSGNPSVVGNGDEDWLGRWQRDDFNRIIMEDVEEIEEVIDEETGEITYESTGNIIPKARFKANPEYDPSQPYIERKDRPEWEYVGMIGVLPLRDDGTCVPGGFAKCGAGGVATAADEWECHRTFFVIERISESVISVEMR